MIDIAAMTTDQFNSYCRLSITFGEWIKSIHTTMIGVMERMPRKPYKIDQLRLHYKIDFVKAYDSFMLNPYTDLDLTKDTYIIFVCHEKDYTYTQLRIAFPSIIQ